MLKVVWYRALAFWLLLWAIGYLTKSNGSDFDMGVLLITSPLAAAMWFVSDESYVEYERNKIKAEEE